MSVAWWVSGYLLLVKYLELTIIIVNKNTVRTYDALGRRPPPAVRRLLLFISFLSVSSLDAWYIIIILDISWSVCETLLFAISMRADSSFYYRTTNNIISSAYSFLSKSQSYIIV